MNQVAIKLNKTEKIKNVEITIQLTPEQIIQAYQKLIKRERQIKKDWICEESFVYELKKRIKTANQEKKENKLIPALQLYKKLGI